MAPTTTKLAMISGASTGIGYYLAQKCADEEGYDILIAADEPQIESAAHELMRHGDMRSELSKADSRDARLGLMHVIIRAANGRPIEYPRSPTPAVGSVTAFWIRIKMAAAR